MDYLQIAKEALLEMLPVPRAPITPSPADLPEDWHLLWEERAAIREYDGGLPRERAEAAALAEVWQQMKRAHIRSYPPGGVQSGAE